MIKVNHNKIKILHLEDLPSDADLVERALKKGGIDFEKIVVDNKIDFENALHEFLPDIILSDHSLPSFDSIQALQIVREKQLHIPFILITSTMTDEFAVMIMRGGADDYIIKDRLHRLPTAVLNCLEKFRLESEKQKFLKKIADNEARFRALIEKSTDMKMLSTQEGKFIYGSPSVEKTFGYSPKEFLLKPASDFFHPDDIPGFYKSRASIAEVPGASFSFQYRLLHKNGNWIWCEGTVTNFLHDPSIQAFVSNFRDISEKKQAEQLREFDKNNLNALINNTNDLMWSVDTNFNLLTSNKPFDEMSMKNFGRVIEKGGDALSVAYSPEMLNHFKQLYERAFSGESFTQIEYFDYPIKIWIEISYYPILNNGLIVGTACHSRDITERKKAEEEIIDKNIQLKSLLDIAQTIREEERKNVAREIHDELGQQLTALKMDIDWILHKQNNPDKKVINKLHEMLKMNDGIINTVRKISSDLRPAIIDDLGLIATIEWKCADFEEKSKILCTFVSTIKERKFSKNFSINVYRILQETLTNVARHAEADNVIVFLAENENELILEIKDNGKGINGESINNSRRLGILGMKERVGILDGELIITGNAQIGTNVKLILPLENEHTYS